MKRILALALLVVPASARADVIFDSFGSGPIAGNSIQIGGTSVPLGYYYPVATTNGRPEVVSSVEFAAFGSAPVSVYYATSPTMSGFATNTLLGTITPAASLTDYTITVGSPLTVSSATPFYLGFVADSLSTSHVAFGGPPQSVSAYLDTNGVFTASNGQSIPAIRIVAPSAAVPEASPLVLAVFGALIVFGVLRHFRHPHIAMTKT